VDAVDDVNDDPTYMPSQDEDEEDRNFENEEELIPPRKKPRPASGSTTSRFIDFNATSVAEFIESQKNANTKRKTASHISLLILFLKSKNENRPPHTIPPRELNTYLSNFFISVQKDTLEDDKDNIDSEYEPVTLKGMQSSFARYLKEQKYEESIITSDIFFESREALASKCRQLKQKGKGNKPKRKRAPTQDELHEMWDKEALGASSPKTLQQTMWWVLCTRFGKRANKENHDMRWGDLEVKKNPNGIKYLVNTERATKTRQGNDTSEVKEVIKVYEDREQPQYCPVLLFEKYKSRRPEEMCQQGSPFYLQPKVYTTQTAMEMDAIWYKKQV
jgi:hypothetical protein